MGRRRYTGQHCAGDDAQERNKSREVTWDGIGRAGCPYGRNDPRYLDTWWEWVNDDIVSLNATKQRC